MQIRDLRPLRDKLFFTSADVAEAAGIKLSSAHVLCSRYVGKGLFVRVKKDFYVLEENWRRFSEKDLFRLANSLQVPSYISLGSALSFYGVSTQVRRGWVESVALKRSVRFEATDMAFHYFRLKEALYCGFAKTEGIFIAAKEKAFVDACHLSLYGGYDLDWDACDLSLLNRDDVLRLAAGFPGPTLQSVKKRLGAGGI
ncbi:MAG: hypothetical protein RBT20_09370 [Syntrophales bacterium]|jgi:predicted transcriptional regulator of viral defense system|nr:hypothetical protein [Syntrophales bacterium]